MSVSDITIGGKPIDVRFHSAQDRLYEILSQRRVMILITVVPAAALFLFVNLLPITWAVWASFHEISVFSPEWSWVGLSNYSELIVDPEFLASIWRSVLFAGGSVALQLIAGTALALLVNRSFKYSSVARAIAMLPYLIPTAVLGFVGIWMGNSQSGIVSDLLLRFGLISETIPWFGSLDWAMPAVVVVSSWKFAIFVTIMVLARLQSIPDGYYEAATVAGANSYQKFRDITLPNLKGVIFIVLLLRGIFMFNKFDIIFVLTRGGPKDATSTAPIFAYEVAFNSLALGKAAATSVLLFVLLIVVAVLYFIILEPEEEVRVE